MNRPMLWVASLFSAGILVGDFVSVRYEIVLGVSLSLAIVALAWSKARRLLLYPLLFSAGWTVLAMHTAILSPYDLRLVLGGKAPLLVDVRGRVSETPAPRQIDDGKEISWHTAARLDVDAIRLRHSDWRPAVGQIAVSTPAALTNLFAGQTVEITGVVGAPRPAAAPGLFDYRAYLKRIGIYYQLMAQSPQDWKILSGSAPPAARFQTWARQALSRGLPAEDESLRLEWALTLGWKPAMTEEVSEPFIRAATYHIFAVDGLRMAIVFGIFFGLFRLLRLPRPVAGFFLLPLIWFYVALTGWPASAIRATVMLSLVIIGWMLRRPTDLFNSLFVAAFIILAFDPQQLFQAGFQLSFLVVLCIILIMPVFKKLEERLFAPEPLLAPHLRRQWHPALYLPAKFCWETLLVSLAAWLGAIPLVAYYFNIFTPVSTPANLVAVPLCGLVLISNLSSLILAGWFPWSAEVFNNAGWQLMDWIRVSSEWFATWPRAYWYVSAPTFFGSVLYYAIFIGLCTGWLINPKWRALKLGALILALGAWAGLAWQRGSETKFFVVPTNGGHFIYFDSPGSKNDLLIDCGNEKAVRSLTKDFLRAQGINRVPNFLMTHGDIHQVGGANALDQLFGPRRVWASPVPARSPAYREALEHFGRNPGLLQAVSKGAPLGSWAVLHPEAGDRFSKGEDSSVVLDGTFSGTKVLLLSELGRAGQNTLLERNPGLHADIVIGGIPAGSEPLCDTLLNAVQPRLVIVTDSEFPVANRANTKLMERLERRRVPVLYTRSAGALTIRLGRKGWVVADVKGARLKLQNPATQTAAPQEK